MEDTDQYSQRSAYVAEMVARLANEIQDDIPEVAAALKYAALDSALYAIRQYEGRPLKRR